MIPSGLLFLISAIMMLSFLMLTQTHIINLVKLLITQNVILTFYLLLKALESPSLELFFSVTLTLIIKVIALPWLLWKLTHYLQLVARIEPIINKPTLLFSGIVVAIFAFELSHQIEPLLGVSTVIGFSLTLANAFLAVLIVLFRRKAISQVIGLLVMENSIFLLAATLTSGFPWLIELGIGFDVLIGFMIFAIFLMRIRATHGSLQTHFLESLKERV